MAIIYKTFRAGRTVFCAVFTCFLMMISPVMAADELFTVEGVLVDVTADSALAARDLAFDKAQIDAFTVLAGRMLSESELASFKAPDAATISPMVQDYEVTAEKLSSVRYIGTYTFSFRASAVERYLNVQGTPYTNVVSAPLVVLPFFQTGGRSFLWSPYNVWMKAWSRLGSASVPVPVIVPIGDLEDVSDIGDDDVFSYKPEKLASLLKRYDAGDAVIAIAIPDGKLSRLTETDSAEGGAVTISLYRTDRGQPEHVQEMVVEAASGDTLAKLLDQAVAEAQKTLKQNWKEKTVVEVAPEVQQPLGNVLTARVKIASLEEWATTQKTLARVNAITSTTLKSLTPREALVELTFRGDEQMLRQALAQSGITLSHPQYAGFGQPADTSRLVYDLTFGGRPVIQPSNYQSPPGQNGYQGGYQTQRQQILDPGPQGGYPLPPREPQQQEPEGQVYQDTPVPQHDDGYTGRF